VNLREKKNFEFSNIDLPKTFELKTKKFSMGHLWANNGQTFAKRKF